MRMEDLVSNLQLEVDGTASDPAAAAALSAKHCWQFELKPELESSTSSLEVPQSAIEHMTCGENVDTVVVAWMSGGGRL